MDSLLLVSRLLLHSDDNNKSNQSLSRPSQIPSCWRGKRFWDFDAQKRSRLIVMVTGKLHLFFHLQNLWNAEELLLINELDSEENNKTLDPGVTRCVCVSCVFTEVLCVCVHVPSSLPWRWLRWQRCSSVQQKSPRHLPPPPQIPNAHLSPQQLADADEDAPQPLVDGERRAGERLPSELHDDDLRGHEQAERQSAASETFLLLGEQMFGWWEEQQPLNASRPLQEQTQVCLEKHFSSKDFLIY